MLYLAIIHCYRICRWMMHPHPHGLLLLAGGMCYPHPHPHLQCYPHPHLLFPDMVRAVAVTVVVVMVVATIVMVIGQPHIIIIGYVSVIYFCSTVKLFLISLEQPGASAGGREPNLFTFNVS